MRIRANASLKMFSRPITISTNFNVDLPWTSVLVPSENFISSEWTNFKSLRCSIMPGMKGPNRHELPVVTFFFSINYWRAWPRVIPLMDLLAGNTFLIVNIFFFQCSCPLRNAYFCLTRNRVFSFHRFESFKGGNFFLSSLSFLLARNINDEIGH